jgi:hypothetical protein
MRSAGLSPVISDKTQARLHRREHKGVISPTRPGELIRSGKQGIDFGTGVERRHVLNVL